MATASAIEDVSSLPGEVVRDQDGRKLGEVKEIYAVGENDTPMWVTVETPTGVGRTRLVFIPIARLKKEGDQIRTPYSFQHIQDSPEVEAGDELSEEDERTLRSYFGIGLADQEMVDNPQSYASQVPDEDEPASKADPDQVEGQVREISDTPPGERAREADEAQQKEKGDEDDREARKATADDVLGESEDGDEGGHEDESKDEGE
jgi:PRC-barrel domain protein